MAFSSASLPIVARGSLRPSLGLKVPIAPFLYPLQQQQVRGAKNKFQNKIKGDTKKKAKGPREYKRVDLKNITQFSLCDAMRYIRAFEVGRDRATSKYEVHIRLKTKKDGPVIRNMLNFPHAVRTEARICVICKPGSKHEKDAREAGAVLIGEQEVFDAIKNGHIDFDRCICHTESFEAMNKAGMGRYLGPRGLMPSAKLGTVTEDVGMRVQMLRGGTIYREREGVIRMPIGQLGFSPDQLRDNLRTSIEQVKKDATRLSDQIMKEIFEVVLSSTQSPGFSLNGDFKSDSSPQLDALTGL
ncbi:hypothetical protein Egran_04746 [Elaphomyces granulatus]|uniref:Ribosomal protein L1 n=1 Tax=Elaphomyces granulatus TaxID=519963 RepID=A0A232LTJ3_9EURO|nr:hypothetical protein Egran_04746 [Elaphomyces granulatus]